jgi:hypothetical protein
MSPKIVRFGSEMAKQHLHERCRLRVDLVGESRSPVIIVDDFLRDADQWVDYAATNAAFRSVRATFYPGDRAPAPMPYPLFVCMTLGKVIADTFGLHNHTIVDASCDFSLVTQQPQELGLLQRVPHTDTPNPAYIAILHYLCTADHGGTSFYRHRRTGFEAVTMDRTDFYFRALKSELAATPPVAAYINGDTPLFERIASHDAAFNRVLIYRGNVLHSGNIPPDSTFSSNPRIGRLTANTFLTFERYTPSQPGP